MLLITWCSLSKLLFFEYPREGHEERADADESAYEKHYERFLEGMAKEGQPREEKDKGGDLGAEKGEEEGADVGGEKGEEKEKGSDGFESKKKRVHKQGFFKDDSDI